MCRSVKTKFLAITLLLTTFFSMSHAASAQIKVEFDPSSGYASEEVETNLVVIIPPETTINGFELEVVSNSIVDIKSFKKLNSPCSLDLFKQNGVVKVICLVNPDQTMTGENLIVTFKLKQTTVGEGEIFIQNADFGEGVDLISAPASFIFEQTNAVVPTDDSDSLKSQSGYFFDIARDWLSQHYRTILLSIIAVCTLTVIYIGVSKRKKIPSQLKLFSIVVVMFAAGTIFYTNIQFSDENLDPTSNAGDQNSPINELESEGADLNGDGVINNIDFEIFRSDFREWEENSRYFSRSDFNQDRNIGLEDYNLFIELYKQE